LIYDEIEGSLAPGFSFYLLHDDSMLNIITFKIGSGIIINSIDELQQVTKFPAYESYAVIVKLNIYDICIDRLINDAINGFLATGHTSVYCTIMQFWQT